VGLAPANTTVEFGSFIVAASGTAGMASKSLISTTLATTTTPQNLLLTSIPSTSDYSVVWKAVASSTGHRNGFMLRAQPTYSGYATGTKLRQGYLFQASSGTNNLRIYKFDTTSTATTLSSVPLTAKPINTAR